LSNKVNTSASTIVTDGNLFAHRKAQSEGKAQRIFCSCLPRWQHFSSFQGKFELVALQAGATQTGHYSGP